VTVAAAARRPGGPEAVEGQTGEMGDLRAVTISETPRQDFASQTSGTFRLGWWNTWRRIGDRANAA